MNAKTQSHHFEPLTWIDNTAAPGRKLSSIQFILDGLGPAVVVVAAALIGVATAITLTGLAHSLPSTQVFAALAVLAAGISAPMIMHSLQDEFLARALLRSAIAAAAGVMAYLALPSGWPMLGFAYTVLLGWTLINWVKDGASPIRIGLASGLTVMALGVIGNV